MPTVIATFVRLHSIHPAMRLCSEARCDVQFDTGSLISYFYPVFAFPSAQSSPPIPPLQIYLRQPLNRMSPYIPCVHRILRSTRNPSLIFRLLDGTSGR